MNINVQLFSILRECLPKGTERGRVIVELPEGATLVQLFERLDLYRCLGLAPEAEKFLTSWQVSLNGEFVFELEGSLKEGDQVTIFPHIVGG